MKEKMKKIGKKIKENKKVVVPIGIVVLVLALALTYAWLVWRGNGNQSIRIKGGSLDLVLDDSSSNGINIDSAIPMSDSQGLDENYTENLYTFTVVNNGTVNAAYELFLDDDLADGDVALSDSNIKYSITRNGSDENPVLLSTATNRKIDEAIVDAGQTYSYTLRLWIDSETTRDVADKVFKGKLRLTGVQTEDSSATVYTVSGKLVDNEGNPISNANVAVFSNPVYTTTDSEGNFSASGLDYGTHSVYYVPGNTSIEGLSKSQIENISGYGKISITTKGVDSELSLSNGYIVQNAKITSGLLDASMIGYTDTYSMGCDNVGCALDKLHEGV